MKYPIIKLTDSFLTQFENTANVSLGPFKSKLVNHASHINFNPTPFNRNTGHAIELQPATKQLKNFKLPYARDIGEIANFDKKTGNPEYSCVAVKNYIECPTQYHYQRVQQLIKHQSQWQSNTTQQVQHMENIQNSAVIDEVKVKIPIISVVQDTAKLENELITILRKNKQLNGITPLTDIKADVINQKYPDTVIPKIEKDIARAMLHSQKDPHETFIFLKEMNKNLDGALNDFKVSSYHVQKYLELKQNIKKYTHALDEYVDKGKTND